jgi:hypothetical protein
MCIVRIAQLSAWNSLRRLPATRFYPDSASTFKPSGSQPFNAVDEVMRCPYCSCPTPSLPRPTNTRATTMPISTMM